MDVEGLRAFLPGSLVDTRPIKDVAHLEDKDIELKVVKIDTKRNNIVVSRKAVIEENNSGDRDAMLEKSLKVAFLKVSLKTSQISVHLSILAELMVYYILPISLGAESATLQMYYL